ncbi:protein phosphatase 2C domain-containing protein [Streptomyces sp. WMMC897]|uniref:protein phosphatase 2C domain-containing protein n=1 Tax=Streptomyces sp. WMMC897 TaxID=3014782 RepID=UPI0022B73A35|nr:protein phosphatase 2C domain-containing protein [Streptomyces sp. WMMC897]MCZ7415935.1 protein phosphatase 2C domain-containing protein [Streptomyces sp. WMMC897]
MTHDWWSRLYADDTPDAGGTDVADSLDDRFAEAARTLGAPGLPHRRQPAEAGPPDAGPPETPRGAEPTESGPPGAESSDVPPSDVPPPGAGEPGHEPDAEPTGARPFDRARAGDGPGRYAAYVGDRPPTYDPEPTAWPQAHAGHLDGLVPDTELDGASYGALTVRAASLRGDSARFRGRARHDALLTARFGAGDDALLLLAVAGSGRTAQAGPQAARDACQGIALAVGRNHARLVDDIRAGRRGALKPGLGRLTGRSLGLLGSRALERGLDPGEYTAWLRCLLLPVDPRCRTRVFFGAGPGGLFRLRDGRWDDIDPGESGGAGKTPDSGVPPFRFRADTARPGDTLLLCSPGMAEPLDGEPDFGRELAARWAARPAPGLAAFLSDVQLRVKGHADDRTAVAVWEG